MSLVFLEYHVLPEYRSEYLKWIHTVKQHYPQLSVYEGSDQPGLFVEIWFSVSFEQYVVMKEERLCTETVLETKMERAVDWTPLHHWIKGGASRLHIWHFQQAGGD